VSKPTPAERDLFAALDALYARLPAIACQGRCAVGCGGGIFLTDAEARRLQLATHRKPKTTDATGRCVYLTADDRCSAYAVRPLACRVWGVVKMLSCMHGCVPDRWLAEPEFIRLAREVERLGGGRLLRTTVGGVSHAPGDSFANWGPPQRSDAAIAADADRTLGLRALFGGRIIMAVDHRQE
jgi:Fe-S-cluster containining protein